MAVGTVPVEMRYDLLKAVYMRARLWNCFHSSSTGDEAGNAEGKVIKDSERTITPRLVSKPAGSSSLADKPAALAEFSLIISYKYLS